MKLSIIDNALGDETREKLSSLFSSLPSAGHVWVDKDRLPPFLLPLVKNASQLLDLSQVKGFELWSHNNTRTSWHIDKDEILYSLGKHLHLPLASLVYYPRAENLLGGELYFTDGTRISPMPDRQIIFSPGEPHRVAPFKGYRVSLLLNAWEREITLPSSDPEILDKLWAISEGEK